MEWRLFCLISWLGGFLLAEIFHRFPGEKLGGLQEISFCGGSLHEKIGWRSLSFLRVFCVFIYLFIICFFYCLFVCLFFIYFYEYVCWVMHQLCDLAPLEGVWSRYFCGVVWRFWWVSSGLSHSPVGLMQDVIKSLHSFLTYCYCCLYLFILLLSIVSV